MKVEIKIPAMGESISEATVGSILKTSGSHVNMDDELIELETDKVNQVLYAQQAGVVNFSVKPGDVVTINQVIGFIDSEGKAEASPSASSTNTETASKNSAASSKPPQKPSSPTPSKEEKKEPKKSSEGQNARISRDDYLNSLKKEPEKSVAAIQEPIKQASPKPEASSVMSVQGDRQETRRKMTKIRQVIAKRLVEAQQQTAMLTTFNEVDMTQVLLLREKYKELFLKEHGVKLGFMSFFIKASIAAMHKCPDLNSYIDQDEIVHREYYDVGVAVSTDRGLMVPVVRNCDRLSFAGIESAIEGYAKKARDGSIRIDDLQGGGFTITNGGVFGSLLSTPILNPPQSGILGMHKIQKRVMVIDDQMVIRPMMYLALSYDHRIVDGKEAVTFLVEIKNFLEDPARLVLDV